MHCKKCGESEPDRDFRVEGLWFCKCRQAKLKNIDAALAWYKNLEKTKKEKK
jgi:hypothetical protein